MFPFAGAKVTLKTLETQDMFKVSFKNLFICENLTIWLTVDLQLEVVRLEVGYEILSDYWNEKGITSYC